MTEERTLEQTHKFEKRSHLSFPSCLPHGLNVTYTVTSWFKKESQVTRQERKANCFMEEERRNGARGGERREKVSSHSLRLPQHYSTLLPSLYFHPHLFVLPPSFFHLSSQETVQQSLAQSRLIFSRERRINCSSQRNKFDCLFYFTFLILFFSFLNPLSPQLSRADMNFPFKDTKNRLKKKLGISRYYRTKVNFSRLCVCDGMCKNENDTYLCRVLKFY